MNRKIIEDFYVKQAGKYIDENVFKKMSEKGNHTFSSIHEILGVITEEYDELKDAVRENNHQKILEELTDLGVLMQFSIACIKQGTLDW